MKSGLVKPPIHILVSLSCLLGWLNLWHAYIEKKWKQHPDMTDRSCYWDLKSQIKQTNHEKNNDFAYVCTLFGS